MSSRLPVKLRRPSYIEIALQLLLAIILALLINEYFHASHANPCPSQDCYPWGMTEGPMDGGSWNYMNEQIYLESTLVYCGVLAAAVITPFFAFGMLSGLGAAFLVLLLGFYNAELLTSLF